MQKQKQKLVRCRIDFVVEVISGTVPLALVFHELATNAVKYGALSKPDGSVDVTIERNGDGATICWTEHGGPSVDVAPTEMGFGSELIESTVVRQLRGTIDRKWDRQGLVVEIGLPARALA